MRARSAVALALVAAVLCPLAAGWTKGLRPGFFSYPPLEITPPVHAPFCWLVFLLFAGLMVLMVGLLLRPRWFGFKLVPPPPPASGGRASKFPAWGWLGILLTATSWVFAWGRFPWLGFMKDHMFAPLWLGYVLTMDGLVHHRTGRSLLARAPVTWLALFPASALSWWYFEYLNRFARNWFYRGIEDFGPLHYIVYASLCFSTVLPAIFETYEWLRSFPRFAVDFSRGPVFGPLGRAYRTSLVILGVLLYFGIGAFPDPFFFALWVAPFLVVGPGLGVAEVETPFHRLRSGDFGPLIGLATAALFCGFFWEMWNFFSLPQWNYSVPYVHAYKVFEMPIVGYTGYLPFGPLCWCLWLALRALLPARVQSRLSGLAL